jgi:hypothetical protein
MKNFKTRMMTINPNVVINLMIRKVIMKNIKMKSVQLLYQKMKVKVVFMYNKRWKKFNFKLEDKLLRKLLIIK